MIIVDEIPNFPNIKIGDNLPEIIINSIIKNCITLNNGDILCVASKIVSTAEKRVVCLDNVKATELAINIHKLIPRKDPRVIQLIIDETGDKSGSRVEVSKNYIAGWLPNGLRLTSAGIDKIDQNHVMLLPDNPDKSASAIGQKIYDTLGVRIGIIITDSDGRIEKKGATQVAIGIYGIPPLRKTYSIDKKSNNQVKESVETLCDLLAATSALIMGQRGTNKPVVIIHGVDYCFDDNVKITDSLTSFPNLQ